MNTKYSSLLLVVPFCSSASYELRPAESYHLKDYSMTQTGSAISPNIDVLWSEAVEVGTSVFALRNIVKEQIDNVLQNTSTFEEKMDALSDYIKDNQKAIRECLKAMNKVDLDDL